MSRKKDKQSGQMSPAADADWAPVPDGSVRLPPHGPAEPTAVP